MNINKLPCPRLQIVWEKDPESEYPNAHIATYELIIHEGEVCRGDIRANDKDDRPSAGVIKVELGKTKTSGGGSHIDADGNVNTPFRDGVHMLRDAASLKLPMFAIYEDNVSIIKQNEEVLKEWGN